MNHLLVTFFLITVGMMSVFPVVVRGTDVVAPTPDTQSTELEAPHALPLAASGVAAAPAVSATSAAAASAPIDAVAAVAGATAAAAAAQPQLNNDLGEIWQEDDREVLIRNARRAKDNNNNGGGSGAAGAGATGAGGAGGSTAAAVAGKKGGRGEKKKTQRGQSAKGKAKTPVESVIGSTTTAVEKNVGMNAKIPQRKCVCVLFLDL